MDLTRAKRAFSKGIHISAFGPRKIDPSLNQTEAWGKQIHFWKESINETREAIRDGNIRRIVEASCLSSPRSVQRLRRHDNFISEIAISDPGKAGLASTCLPAEFLNATHGIRGTIH